MLTVDSEMAAPLWVCECVHVCMCVCVQVCVFNLYVCMCVCGCAQNCCTPYKDLHRSVLKLYPQRTRECKLKSYHTT